MIFRRWAPSREVSIHAERGRSRRLRRFFSDAPPLPAGHHLRDGATLRSLVAATLFRDGIERIAIYA